MIGIYKITNPKNRVYIGQSIDIQKRFNTYKKEFGIGQTKLKNSLLKYGIENHNFEVVTECLVSELNELERYYQEIYNCINNGLNCVYVNCDSRSGKVSEETRLKMVKAQTGNKKWLGKKHTKETKIKISKALKGIKRSKEYCNARSERMKGKHTGMISPSTKIVLDLSNGIFYDSLVQASKSYNIKYCTLKKYVSNYPKYKNKANLIYV
jgi:group I intron endonuclease